jgi:hypothetical protein
MMESLVSTMPQRAGFRVPYTINRSPALVASERMSCSEGRRIMLATHRYRRMVPEWSCHPRVQYDGRIARVRRRVGIENGTEVVTGASEMHPNFARHGEVPQQMVRSVFLCVVRLVGTHCVGIVVDVHGMGGLST